MQAARSRWLRQLTIVGSASALTLVFPAALLASLVLLPTTPSGALWLFAVLMGACGYLARAAAPSGSWRLRHDQNPRTRENT